VASVLIIEDEAPLTRMMAVFLLDAGFEVATADSVDKALTKVKTYKPDLIVFNTVMDDATKRHSIAQLRDGSPASKVLDVSIEKNRLMRGIVAGHDGDGALNTVSLDGASAQPGTPGAGNADGFLQLPFEASLLIATLNELMAREPKQMPTRAP
jgi:CheY-like chemotaxis protein